MATGIPWNPAWLTTITMPATGTETEPAKPKPKKRPPAWLVATARRMRAAARKSQVRG